MNRFSVIHLFDRQYHHTDCSTQSEAESSLQALASQYGYLPIGIYDAKTELFNWEPTLEDYYRQASIEEQGKLGNHITSAVQQLRKQSDRPVLPSLSVVKLLNLHTV